MLLLCCCKRSTPSAREVQGGDLCVEDRDVGQAGCGVRVPRDGASYHARRQQHGVREVDKVQALLGS
jgi:hypothetical protein